jgi:hypothetical protein
MEMKSLLEVCPQSKSSTEPIRIRNLSFSNLSDALLGQLCQRFVTLTLGPLHGIPELKDAAWFDGDRR